MEMGSTLLDSEEIVILQHASKGLSSIMPVF